MTAFDAFSQVAREERIAGNEYDHVTISPAFYTRLVNEISGHTSYHTAVDPSHSLYGYQLDMSANMPDTCVTFHSPGKPRVLTIVLPDAQHPNHRQDP